MIKTYIEIKRKDTGEVMRTFIGELCFSKNLITDIFNHNPNKKFQAVEGFLLLDNAERFWISDYEKLDTLHNEISLSLKFLIL